MNSFHMISWICSVSKARCKTIYCGTLPFKMKIQRNILSMQDGWINCAVVKGGGLACSATALAWGDGALFPLDYKLLDSMDHAIFFLRKKVFFLAGDIEPPAETWVHPNHSYTKAHKTRVLVHGQLWATPWDRWSLCTLIVEAPGVSLYFKPDSVRHCQAFFLLLFSVSCGYILQGINFFFYKDQNDTAFWKHDMTVFPP